MQEPRLHRVRRHTVATLGAAGAGLAMWLAPSSGLGTAFRLGAGVVTGVLAGAVALMLSLALPDGRPGRAPSVEEPAPSLDDLVMPRVEIRPQGDDRVVVPEDDLLEVQEVEVVDTADAVPNSA